MFSATRYFSKTGKKTSFWIVFDGEQIFKVCSKKVAECLVSFLNFKNEGLNAFCEQLENPFPETSTSSEGKEFQQFESISSGMSIQTAISSFESCKIDTDDLSGGFNHETNVLSSSIVLEDRGYGVGDEKINREYIRHSQSSNSIVPKSDSVNGISIREQVFRDVGQACIVTVRAVAGVDRTVGRLHQNYGRLYQNYGRLHQNFKRLYKLHVDYLRQIDSIFGLKPQHYPDIDGGTTENCDGYERVSGFHRHDRGHESEKLINLKDSDNSQSPKILDIHCVFSEFLNVIFKMLNFKNKNSAFNESKIKIDKILEFERKFNNKLNLESFSNEHLDTIKNIINISKGNGFYLPFDVNYQIFRLDSFLIMFLSNLDVIFGDEYEYLLDSFGFFDVVDKMYKLYE